MNLRHTLFFLIGILPLLSTGCDGKKTEAPLMTNTLPVVAPIKSAPKPPILAQSTLTRYGPISESYIGFEGKIYNPNSVALTNVRVRWQVYAVDGPGAKEFRRTGRWGESCEFEFAYIPPQTTYDFHTGKIAYRSADNIDSLGITPAIAPTINQKPEITFTTEP